MTVKLHDFWRSSAAYRVRIALNMKGIAYETVVVDLKNGAQKGADFLAVNPQGLVPTIEIDGHRISQSLAIIDYLDAKVDEPRLVPKDPAARAQVLSRALTIACDIHPINNLRVLRYVKRQYDQDQAAIDAWIAHWITEGFAPLESDAKARGGAFLSGDRPGLDDICLIPQIYNARRYDVPLDAFPTLVAIDAAATALPAFARAHPDVVRRD